MEGFSNLKPKAANSRYKDEVRLDEVLDIYKLPDAELVEMRFLPGPIIALKQHWVKIRAGKDKREIKVSRWCIAFDPANEAVGNGKQCPYCELSTGDNGSQQVSMKYYVNAIIRDIQENEPRNAQKPTKEERKSGFIQKGSKSFTPVRVVALPPSLVEKIQFVEQRNIHAVKAKGSTKKEKKAFPISHPKFGIDIGIQFDNSKAGGDKYVIDKGQRTPLTEEEQSYLVWNLNPDLIDKLGIKSEEEAAEDFKRMDIIGATEIDEEDDDDEDLGSKKKSKKKKASKFDSDDKDEDEEDEEDEDLGSKKKSKKSKKPAKSKFDSDDEDDEDDEPVKKKKKSKLGTKSKKSKLGTKKKKSKPVDGDEDEDEDEPVKKKKKLKTSSDKKKKSKK